MSEPTQAKPPRILEIGVVPYMYEAFPRTTDFFSTWRKETLSDPAKGRHIVSLGNLLDIKRRLADPAYDLVVVQPGQFAPWTLRSLSRSVFRRGAVHGAFPVVRNFGLELLRGRVAAPVAVFDLEDPAVIDRSALHLWDKAVLYFKRELPPDHWLVFNGTAHWRVPTTRYRSVPLYRERIAKLRPISLGLPFPVWQGPVPTALPAAEKTVDVFFAGRVEGSATVRERGFPELMALRAEGLKIDVPEERLSQPEFLARCARAWLVWSPSGYGWQCYRTYEAAYCGSVPLINRPVIEQHRPLVEGEHAVYYEVESGGLTRAIRAALADRQKLMTMAAAARAHVQAWHTPKAVAQYLVETTLATARRK